MHTTLATLINRLESDAVSGTGVIPWACPVPAFGDVSASRVATLGLNPSNREFVDESGRELHGGSRRFHTLGSLGLSSWSEVNARHLRLILESCRVYFQRNPYDIWFRRLDSVISGAKTSYYDSSRAGCHLDLIPYATTRKWTDLTRYQRSSLLAATADTLGLLLRDSPIRILILNGKSVLHQFQDIAGIRLEGRRMGGWSLPRRSRRDVAGFAHRGAVDTVAGIGLGKELLVLGFNHNLQSSFGVTREILDSMRTWISRVVVEALQ